MLMMLVALALTGLSSCHDDEDAPEVKPEQRTLFMYFPWSTNLTDYFYDNILAMEEAIAKAGLDNERVIVFISTSSSEAEMFEITCNGGKCTRTELKAYDNPSLTTAAGISGILSDMKTFAPADVYAMTIGCHGMGWLPVESKYKAKGQAPAFVPHYSVDKGYAMTRYFGGVTSDDQTDISTLADAISDAGLKMEFILFDDCYMSSVEVAYDLRHVTGHIIACPTEIMAYGTLGITDCSQLDALAEIMKLINSRYEFDSLQLYSLQRMDGYTPVLFFDFGDYVEHLCPDEALLAEFKSRLARAVPYAVHTEQYYSSYRGAVDINTYSGITTSEPSTHSLAADVVDTNWYKATH